MGGASRRALMERLNDDARRLAARFGLSHRAVESERPNVKRRYGACFSDGTIRIRLHHAVTRRPLKYSSLINTLCHELAHLRHFNHGPRFKAFYFAILEYARSEGIYRPGPPPGAEAGPALAPRVESRVSGKARSERAAPEQLGLFGD